MEFIEETSLKKHEVFGGKCKRKYVRLDLQQNRREHYQQRIGKEKIKTKVGRFGTDTNEK